MEKLVVICGPTAAGKSKLAVELAKKHDGEVVSTDSRQVYRGLDIATGKITESEMKGITHHLLDVADPEDNFTVANFKKFADAAIADIHKQNRLPIICGGSGFYIQAVVDDLALPNVRPNKDLREKLRKRSTESLFKEIKEKDPRRANEIDENNPVRLIRALEIIAELGKVPELKKQQRFDTFQIGLDWPDKKLKNRIIKRTKQRLEEGMIEEARKLHKNGLSFTRMEKLGLEYELLAQYLKEEISKQELFKQTVQADWQYAKKQRSWFKKDDRIHWFHPKREQKEIKQLVKKFADQS